MKKLILFILVAVIIIGSVFYMFYPKAGVDFNLLISNCEKMMLSKYANYTICCVDDGVVEDCTNKKSFVSGENVIFFADLKKLNEYFDPYYACLYSSVPQPLITPEIENLSYFDLNFKCTKQLSQREYHSIYHFGAVPNLTDDRPIEFVITFYPQGDYSTKQDFLDYLENKTLEYSPGLAVKVNLTLNLTIKQVNINYYCEDHDFDNCSVLISELKNIFNDRIGGGVINVSMNVTAASLTLKNKYGLENFTWPVMLIGKEDDTDMKFLLKGEDTKSKERISSAICMLLKDPRLCEGKLYVG